VSFTRPDDDPVAVFPKGQKNLLDYSMYLEKCTPSSSKGQYTVYAQKYKLPNKSQ
jgi:hypothetical protein